MKNLTTKCNYIMFALAVVLILLISSVASQRRWAGTYPTEPPPETAVNKQCNCEKPDFEEGKQLSPENPNYAKEDIGRGDDTEERERIHWEPPEISVDRRHNERKNLNSRVDVERRIEITSSERGPVLTMIQKSPEEHRPNDRSDSRSSNVGKDAYPGTGSRRNDDPKGTLSRDRSDVEDRDSREDSFRNYQSKRGDELPKSERDSTALRGTKMTTSRPTDSNIRTYSETRKDYIPKSDRNDDEILVTYQNFTKDSRFETGRKDFELSNERSTRKPLIQSEAERKEATLVNSRTGPRNYRPNGGSNVNNRPTLKPLSTGRSYGVTQFESNIRKEDRSTVGSSRKNEDERGRRYGTPCTSGTCEYEAESKLPKNQNNPPRIPPRPYPVTARTFPQSRFLQDSPKIIPETKIEDRKVIVEGRNINRKVGFHSDVSYDTIVFPKDDDDDDSGSDEYGETEYRQSGGRSSRNHQRSRTRNKRNVDLHEDVEIIPGFDSSNRRKEVLKHYDEVDETEIDVFSPVEIKIKKSS